MLNENKIKMMTKMAIYEKNEGRQMIKNSRYFKGDYVAFGVLRTLIATTFAYIIMVILCYATLKNWLPTLIRSIMRQWEKDWEYIIS